MPLRLFTALVNLLTTGSVRRDSLRYLVASGEIARMDRPGQYVLPFLEADASAFLQRPYPALAADLLDGSVTPSRRPPETTLEYRLNVPNRHDVPLAPGFNVLSLAAEDGSALLFPQMELSNPGQEPIVLTMEGVSEEGEPVTLVHTRLYPGDRFVVEHNKKVLKYVIRGAAKATVVAEVVLITVDIGIGVAEGLNTARGLPCRLVTFCSMPDDCYGPRCTGTPGPCSAVTTRSYLYFGTQAASCCT